MKWGFRVPRRVWVAVVALGLLLALGWVATQSGPLAAIPVKTYCAPSVMLPFWKVMVWSVLVSTAPREVQMNRMILTRATGTPASRAVWALPPVA